MLYADIAAGSDGCGHPAKAKLLRDYSPFGAWPPVTSAFAVSERNAGAAALSAYAETMDYLSEHLASLRQEISDLSTANQRYSQHRQHSPIEQSASDVRRSRLLEIKRELSTMMNCPPDSSVWWDRRRK